MLFSRRFGKFHEIWTVWEGNDGQMMGNLWKFGVWDVFVARDDAGDGKFDEIWNSLDVWSVFWKG